MAIIIGGSPSTGSSLLSTILNRHSEVLCIQESHLLAKAQFYNNWGSVKMDDVHNGRYLSPGWHIYNRVDLSKELICKIDPELSFVEFIEKYFNATLRINNKKIWAEKTPGNIYFFHKLNSILKNPHFIITMRNPYDVIASLISRGISIFDAVCQVVISMSISLIQKMSVQSNVVKYESLVREPSEEIDGLLDKLGLPKEDLLHHNVIPKTKMKGWKYHEDGLIGSDSINRFDNLDPKVQSQIAYLIDTIVINEKHLMLFDLAIIPCGFKDVLDAFGYEFKNIDKKALITYPNYWKDRFTRLYKNNPTAYNYPVVLK